jgi:hypothetical protein
MVENCQRPRLVQPQFIFVCESFPANDRMQASFSRAQGIFNINSHLFHRNNVPMRQYLGGIESVS